MIRFNKNEINELIKEDYNNNLNNIKFLNEIKNFIDEDDFILIKEDLNLSLLKNKSDSDKITSLSQLEIKINNIMENEPKGVIRAIKIYKILSYALTLLATMSVHTAIIKYGTGDGAPDYSFSRLILSAIGCFVTGAVINQIDAKFLSKIAGSIIRFCGGSKCKASDREKVRLLNELIKSIDKNINKSKNTIEKEALTNSMNKAIDIRDQVISRLNLVNKSSKPIYNDTTKQPNNTQSLEANNNGN